MATRIQHGIQIFEQQQGSSLLSLLKFHAEMMFKANCRLTDIQRDNRGILVHPPERLEDLKVLRRSPDLLNNFKTGQGQLQLIMKHILLYHIWGLQPFWSSNLNNVTPQ